MKRIPYKQVPIRNNGAAPILRPFLGIILINGARTISTAGIIDTGADKILINAQFAKQLNIDLVKCKTSSTTGIIGKPVQTYIAELELEIIDLPNSRFSTTVQFIKSPNVGILLGQYGFFDNFKVSFEKYNNFFEIDVKP